MKADCLSSLPEHLIHHIMSFLSYTEGTRFSVSSKCLSSIWSSCPVVDFGWTRLNKGHDKNLMFLKFVCDSLSRRCTLKSNFEKLSFFVTSGYYYGLLLKIPEVLENLLNFASDKKIRELRLGWGGDLFRPDPRFKSLPMAIFSVKTIRIISFSGLKFDTEDLILSCPLIEKFKIANCIGFKSIVVAASVKFIKRIKINCSGLERIHMIEGSPARLESFSYSHFSVDLSYCEININLASRNSLKFFKLEMTHITEEWFLNQVSKFVSLEHLTLSYCKTSMRSMCINNKLLKCLKLECCDPLQNVDISVPGLESFLYNAKKLVCDQIKIRHFTLLKNLELSCVIITDKLVENLRLSGLVFLENLRFEYCNFMLSNSFKLYFENLKSLALQDCEYLVTQVLGNLEILSPNLVSFTYTGKLMPSIPVSVISSNTHVSADIFIDYRKGEDKFQFQKDWRDFLSFFGHCKVLFLSHDFTEVNIIYYYIMLHHQVSGVFEQL